MALEAGSKFNRELLLAEGLKMREMGPSDTPKKVLAQVDDGTSENFSAEQVSAMEESNRRDSLQYLDRAEKLGLLIPGHAARLRAPEVDPFSLADTVARLMPQILIEERNLGILFDALEEELITEDLFKTIMSDIVTTRTMICNDLHTKLRVKRGENLAQKQLTFAGIAHDVGAAVQKTVDHPFDHGNGIRSF